MRWKDADGLEMSVLLATDATQWSQWSEVPSGEIMAVAVWIGGQEQVKQVTFIRCAVRYFRGKTPDLMKVLRNSECLRDLTSGASKKVTLSKEVTRDVLERAKNVQFLMNSVLMHA